MNTETNQHSMLQSVSLHLLPGLLGGIGYLLIVPLVRPYGLPLIYAVRRTENVYIGI